MILKFTTAIVLFFSTSAPLNALKKFPNLILSNKSKITTNNYFIELPETIEIKSMDDKLFIYRSVKEKEGLHIKSHRFIREKEKTPSRELDTIESKAFRVRVVDSSKLNDAAAKYVTKIVVLSGTYKGLKAGDKVENTYTYELTDKKKIN